MRTFEWEVATRSAAGERDSLFVPTKTAYGGGFFRNQMLAERRVSNQSFLVHIRGPASL